MKSDTSPVLLSLRSAAELIGIRSLCHARHLLGVPDMLEQRKNGHKALYTPEHIERTRQELELHRKQRISDKGKRSCYHCRKKFTPGELKSGICADCQAWKTVLNFSCNGDCLNCPVDCRRLNCLKNAVTRMERRLELFYR